MNYPRMPKKRPDLRKRRKEKPKEDIDHRLDKAVEDTFPTSDPVATTSPGGPVDPNENPKEKHSGQNPDQAGKR
jgi:hypothetical protein